MNSWAAEGKYDCHFLCVCVLGDSSAIELAREMSRQMKLTHCVNGFVGRREDMPTYGQLGCRGFFVLDREHRMISACTSSFMEVKQIAFHHVEALLDATCGGKPLPKICPGEFMELVVAPEGKPELLGSRGLCVKLRKDGEVVEFCFVDGKLRGRVMPVPVSSVKLVEMEEEGSGESSCAGGDCGSGKCDTNKCGTGNCGTGKCGTGSCGDAKCGPGGCENGSCNDGSCSTGGCDLVGCDKNCELDADFVSSSLDLVSVQVPSMDAEHAECVTVLRRLITERSAESLKAVRGCLGEHFAHEEALFEEFGFGAHENEKLSARKSHADDHRRIIEKLDKAQVQLSGRSGTALAAGFIRELLQDFHEHTSRYDVQYSSYLGERGAK